MQGIVNTLGEKDMSKVIDHSLAMSFNNLRHELAQAYPALQNSSAGGSIHKLASCLALKIAIAEVQAVIDAT